ncbi:MAG: Ohr family peroxiredoxin [Ruminococcaceae bacterium]|nr:Ohr family peroxiredoxin [Oscillospiraceae bacterium]
MKNMKKLYTATVVNTGGRDGGQSQATDGSFTVRIAPPGSAEAQEAQSTNPEQLFAAGYSACFNGALRLALKQAGVRFQESKVTVTVDLLQDDGGFSLSVDIAVAIDGFSQAENQKYADVAHTICPYSKAVQGNIPVTVRGT